MVGKRIQLIEIALRRARPGTGTAESVLRETGGRYEGAAVDRYLKDMDYVIVGGLATSLYMQERATLDTDVLIRRENLDLAESALAAAGCMKEGILSIGGSTWRTAGGKTIDLIAVDEPWVDEAIANPVEGLGGRQFIALPYLVAMKLTAGRVQDLADITRMLGHAGEKQIEEVLHTIRKYRPQDKEDVMSMIELGRLEYDGLD